MVAAPKTPVALYLPEPCGNPSIPPLDSGPMVFPTRPCLLLNYFILLSGSCDGLSSLKERGVLVLAACPCLSSGLPVLGFVGLGLFALGLRVVGLGIFRLLICFLGQSLLHLSESKRTVNRLISLGP